VRLPRGHDYPQEIVIPRLRPNRPHAIKIGEGKRPRARPDPRVLPPEAGRHPAHELARQDRRAGLPIPHQLLQTPAGIGQKQGRQHRQEHEQPGRHAPSPGPVPPFLPPPNQPDQPRRDHGGEQGPAAGNQRQHHAQRRQSAGAGNRGQPNQPQGRAADQQELRRLVVVAEGADHAAGRVIQGAGGAGENRVQPEPLQQH
jgi:hypothetical protein